VASILQAALEAEGDAFHLWEIQKRAKSLKSLRDKLLTRGLLEHSNIENEIKDLAGCRLIFYSNDDVDRFLRSGIVRANFDVDWDRSIIHQPVEETQDAAKLYRADHYLVSLKADRAKLPEYSRFSTLKCEIQVQTILNHAWSETGHDVIYKPPKLVGFGTKQHAEIKDRMTRIMKQYLLPAGYEFQKVLYDFKRLSQGQELFDRDVLHAIETATDNNERFEILERFRDHVIPNYDDISGVFQEILQITSRAIELARTTETKPISTPFGNFPGKKSEDITDVALKIIEFIRYVDPQKIFSRLCNIYLHSSSDKERKRIVEVTNKLAEHNMSVWKQAGPYIQSLLTQQLNGFSDDQLKNLQPIVIEFCQETLNPQIEGTTSTFNTLTIHTGAVVVSDELKLVRQRAIKILERLYCLADKESDKRNIITAINNAMRIPMRGDSDELLVMVLNDTGSIFEFYQSRVGNEQYEILQSLEHDALWTYRRTKQWINSDKIGRNAIDAGKLLISTIELYRGSLNQDEDFVRYKTLVGFESVFPGSWENDNFDIEAADTYRSQKISEYVDSITIASAGDWFEFIKRCAKTQSNDLATFPSFAQFLKLLSEKKPDIALSYLASLNDDVAAFLPAFLGGLWTSNRRNEVQELVNGWVRQRLHLNAIIRHYRNEGLCDRNSLKNALEAAIEVDNAIAVIEVVNVCIEHHDKANSAVLLNIFLHAIEFLTQKKDARWARSIWFKANKSSLFGALDADQVKIVLLNLVHCPHIEYDTEQVLSAIAKKHPEAVVRYFGDRIQFEISQDDKHAHEQPYLERYEAIPYKFHYLPKFFSGIPEQVVRIVRSWYTKSSYLFTFRGGRLLANIFDSFPDAFQNELIAMIRSKNVEDIDFVLAVLRDYEGETFLHATCREIVMALPEDDQIRMNTVEIILESTGVVSGEFGLVEAYKKRIAEIQPWLEDVNQAVCKFATGYIASLNRQIAAEHRRAEQELELRKRNFGENEVKQD
jgi:ppGpp synthetase/RelA/SpoT-type nucleotidyltranferase